MFIPLSVKNLSLDPELGSMTYGAKVGGQVGVASDVARTWPEVSATVHGAMNLGADL